MIVKSEEEVAAALAETVTEVMGGSPVVLTRDGRPVAAIVTFGDYEWLEEMEDRWLSELVERIESDPDYDPNDTVPADEFFAALRAGHAAE